MTFTLDDKRDKIRAQLIYELNHPEIWYSKSDVARAIRNKDTYVNHPECPYSNGLGFVREYWYVWWLNNPNDPIMYREVIHHINGNHSDNRIENLVKITAKEHRKIHGATISNSKKTNKLTSSLCKEV